MKGSRGNSLNLILLGLAVVFITSISINFYTYMYGYYLGPRSYTDLEVPIYRVNKLFYPLSLETTGGEIRLPIEGRVVVLVPQYVDCPNVCQDESLIMRYAMERVAELGLSDKVVWVTIEVDPWGSSRESVRGYMDSILGDLKGEVAWYWVLEEGEDLEKLWAQLNIRSERDPKTGLVSHTAGFYIVDPTGMIRYYIKPQYGAINNAWADPKLVGDKLVEVIIELALGERR